MVAYADLEIGLHRWDANGYTIDLRYSQPDSDADIRLGRSDTTLVRFDFAALQAAALDPAAYGKLLSAQLFADSSVQSAFAQARTIVYARLILVLPQLW